MYAYSLVILLQRRAKSTRACEFTEVPVTLYWSFKSAENPKWFLGFSRKGKPLQGSAHVGTRRPKCFRFSKKSGPHASGDDFNIDRHNEEIGQAPPGWRDQSFPSEQPVPFETHRHRHAKQHIESRPRANHKSSRSRQKRRHFRHSEKSQRNHKSYLRKSGTDR